MLLHISRLEMPAVAFRRAIVDGESHSLPPLWFKAADDGQQQWKHQGRDPIADRDDQIEVSIQIIRDSGRATRSAGPERARSQHCSSQNEGGRKALPTSRTLLVYFASTWIEPTSGTFATRVARRSHCGSRDVCGERVAA